MSGDLAASPNCWFAVCQLKLVRATGSKLFGACESAPFSFALFIGRFNKAAQRRRRIAKTSSAIVKWLASGESKLMLVIYIYIYMHYKLSCITYNATILNSILDTHHFERAASDRR